MSSQPQPSSLHTAKKKAIKHLQYSSLMLLKKPKNDLCTTLNPQRINYVISKGRMGHSVGGRDSTHFGTGTAGGITRWSKGIYFTQNVAIPAPHPAYT
jgi:hypothetical protein